jgi:hypothetical protein
MVDLDNWLVGNPLVIPKFDVKAKAVTMAQATGDQQTGQGPTMNI